MISRVLSLLLFFAFAQAAAAQTVAVRSGDHDSFTRLVLNLPDRLDWTSESTPTGASVIFPKNSVAFDTSAVFDRITRDRLTNISAPTGAARLDLTFDCKCTLRPFWNDRTMLVLDIAENPVTPAAENPAKRSVVTPRSSVVGMVPMKPEAPSAAAEMMTAQHGSARGTRTSGSVPLPRKEDAGDTAQAGNVNLPKMQEELLNNLARAASQGLLTPNRATRARPSAIPDYAASAPTQEPEKPVAVEPLKETTTPLPANLNLHAQSSIDREIRAHIEGNFSLSGHPACISDDLIALPDWGDEAPFHQQIGALSGRLLGEFDMPNPVVALELARLYAYFGFGYETRQILNIVEIDAPGTDILSEIATILDEGHARQHSLFTGQLGCDNAAALWSALSYETLPQDRAIDLNAIERNFAALPQHLRLYLGPLLARKLTRAGHVESADQVLRILERAQTDEAPEATMARAELAQAEGDPEEAKAELETVVESNAQPSADAVLKLIDQRLAAREEISFDLAQLAGAYAQENRGAELGQNLARAYLSALAASGAFGESFGEFDRLAADLAPDSKDMVRQTLIEYLVTNADDLTFLRHTLAGQARNAEALAPEVSSAIAQRLLENGFETEALDFVSAPLPGRKGRTQRLIRAEIALAKNQPRQAEVELIGLSGLEADALRAQALDMVGEHRAASEYFMASDQPTKAQEANWLAEDWDQIIASDDPVLQNVARLMQADSTTSDPQANGVLAKNRRLLEDSAKARATLGNLLEAKPAPEAPES